ncbi:MAG: flagellar basal body rod protein FlgC [Vulcanimicrobiota bacterium]
MEFFSGLQISASGMMAERRRLETISSNISNANTHQIEGQPLYKAQRLVTAPAESQFKKYLAGFRELPGQGVSVMGVAQEELPPRMVYEPGHPDADENGYVAYPDINVLDEMVHAITASRSYEANLTTFNETKRMLTKALEIGK